MDFDLDEATLAVSDFSEDSALPEPSSLSVSAVGFEDLCDVGLASNSDAADFTDAFSPSLEPSLVLLSASEAFEPPGAPPRAEVGYTPGVDDVRAVIRLRPGVLGNAESTAEESFSRGLLEHPQYTRPPLWEGREIPEVLLSGHHARIAKWRIMTESSLVHNGNT